MPHIQRKLGGCGGIDTTHDLTPAGIAHHKGNLGIGRGESENVRWNEPKSFSPQRVGWFIQPVGGFGFVCTWMKCTYGAIGSCRLIVRAELQDDGGDDPAIVFGENACLVEST